MGQDEDWVRPSKAAVVTVQEQRYRDGHTQRQGTYRRVVDTKSENGWEC
jgi:hypothetical protein